MLKKACVLLVVVSLMLFPKVSTVASYVDQSNALKAYERIWNTFDLDDNGCPIYPDEYGGEYIDGETLFVWLVDLSDDLMEKYSAICNESEYVSFLDAKHSLNEMDSWIPLVMDSDLPFDVVGCVADRKENKMKIYVSEITRDAEEYFDDTIGLGNYVLEQQEKITLYTNLYSGEKIVYSTSEFTLGTCGTYNSQPAILTAGHCVSGTGAQIRYQTDSGTIFAQTCNYNFEDDGTGDFAIATILSNQQSNFTLTNYLKPVFTPQAISGTAFNGWAPIGTNLYVYGQMSGLHGGQITQLNVSFTCDDPFNPLYDVTICGLIQVTPSSTNTQGGDSGGPIFMNYLNLGIQFLGTLTGGHTNPFTHTEYFYYSPVSYAQAAGFIVKTS